MALEQENLKDPNAPTVVSPLTYLQVGQQLFNRELAQPEIGYLQSLYGQDVDPTEMTALQAALNPNQNIQNLYQSVLGRQADPFGGMYWSQAFGSEVSPEEEAAFRQAAAPEIAARPSGLDQIKGLYTDVLGREADQPGLDYWANQFGAEVSPEERAAFQLAAAPEITARSAGALNNNTLSAAGNDSVSAASVSTQPWWAGQFASEADANFVDTNRNQQIEDSEKAIWRTFHDPNSEEYQQRVAYNAYLAAPKTSSGVALSTIKNEFDAIYDDQTLTGPQKAIKVQQLANTKNYSNADLAKALGVTEEVLGTFFGQEQPNWEQDFTGQRVRYIDPVTGEKVLADVYLENANTPEAIKYRTDNAPYLNFVNKSGLGRETANKIWNSTDTYLDPIDGKDYTAGLRNYLAKQLTERGITDFWQLETQVTPGKAAYFQPGFKGSGRFIDAVPEIIKVIDTKTGKEIDNVLFDDKAGTKYIVTSNGIQKQFDPDAKVAAQASRYIDLNSSSGDAWSYFGAQGMVNQIGRRVRDLTGIDDINDLKPGTKDVPVTYQVYKDPDSNIFYSVSENGERTGTLSPEEVQNVKAERFYDGEGGWSYRYSLDSTVKQQGVYNKKTGDFIPMERAGWSEPFISLGGWGEGDGMTYAYLKFDANGKPKIQTLGADSENWVKEILATVAILTLPWTLGASSSLLAGEAALASELGGLAVLGEGAGAAAAATSAGGFGLASVLPVELVEAGKTLYSAYNTVKGPLQLANSVYQLSQGNLENALLSTIDAASIFGVDGAKEIGQVLNAGLAASKGNYLPALQTLLSQTNVGSELASTKIGDTNFTVGDAINGVKFGQALSTGDITQILNASTSLIDSQDLKVAAAANNFINILNNPRATAFDIAISAERVAGALNNASKQPPKGALPTGGQSTVTGALGTDSVSGALGNDVIDEYNVTGGGGALISSGNPAEDEQIALAQRVTKANQAIADYAGSGNDLSREGLVSQLQSFGLTADQAEGYAQKADQQINMNRVGADVMNRYSKIDPEFGTPQLDRNTAVQEMVAAGFTSDRANEILNGIDAQNAIKLENKLSVQSAYNNLIKGTGTQEQLRSAMTSAGYTDNEINNLVTKGLGILEGSKLTAGEQAQERASQLPDVRAEIAAKPTFGEAYGLARATYGSGATFTWQGKSYSTDTFQENPALGLVPVAGSGRGQAEGKTAEQEAALENTRQMLLQQRNAPTNVESSGFWGNLSRALSDQMKLSSDAANAYLKNNPDSPITQAVSTGVEAAGNLQKNIIGGTALLLDNKPVANAFIKGGDELIKLGQSIGTGPQDTKNWKDTLDLIDKATGFEKIGVLAGRVFDGTSGLGRQTVMEIRQEFPALFLGGGTARGVLIASGLIDTKDTMGGAAIDAYDDAIKVGKSHKEALSDARMAGTAAGATEAALQLTLGKLGDLAVGKLDNVIAKGAGRIGAEGITEGAQEGGSSLAQDLALGRDLDLNKALTQTVVGTALGKSTSATTAPVSTAQDLSISNEVGNSIANIQSIYGDQKASTSIEALVGSTNLSGDSQLLTNELSNLMGESAAVVTVNNLAGAIALQKAGTDLADITLEDVSVVIGKSPTGADVTLLNAIGSQVTGNGANVPLDTKIGTRADGSVVTLGDIRQVVNPSLVSQETQPLSDQTLGSQALDSKLPSDGSGAGATVGTGPFVSTGPVDSTGAATDLGLQLVDDGGGYTGPSVGTGPIGSTGPVVGTGSSIDTGPATDVGLLYSDQDGYAGPSISTGPAVSTEPFVSTGPVDSTGAATDLGLQLVEGDGYTGSRIGDQSAVKSDGTSNIKIEQDGDNLIQTKTNIKTGDTTQIIQNPNGTQTITKDENGGSVVSVNQNGTTSITEVKGDVVINTDGNLTTTLNTQTNTFVVVNQGNDTVGGGNIQDLDPKIISDVIKINDLNPVVTTAPTEVQKSESKAPVTRPVATAPKSSFDLPAAGAAVAAAVDWLGPQFLKSKERGGYVDPLAEFQALQQQADQRQILSQIQPELANVLTERGAMPYYTYGQEPSIDEVLGLPEQESSSYNESDYVPVFKSGGKVSPLNIQMMYAKGGHAREDFRDGKHVAGPGDGQSDDIPAWLADGEFVFPADVVSALGNGSTKAGTEKLYEMMHEIRGRARSKHPKDLPPPAHKSPLDYLKKGK